MGDKLFVVVQVDELEGTGAAHAASNSLLRSAPHICFLDTP